MRIRLLMTIFIICSAVFYLGAASAFRMGPLRGDSTEIDEARTSIAQTLIAARSGSEEILNSVLSADDENGTKYEVISHLRTKYPLLQNELLDNAAAALCTANVTGVMPSLDDNLTSEYLATIGYLAQNVHMDKTGLILQEYMDPNSAALLLLNTYLRSNIEMADNGSALFDDQFLELGVGYCGGITRLPGMKAANTYMMIIILARPAEPQPYWIQCGHVFYDTDYNNIFEPGEGLRNVKLTDDNGTLLAVTLSDGQYCFRRPPGEWTLYVGSLPFREDYNILNILIAQRQGGVLYQDFPIWLTQEDIDKLENEELQN